MFYIKEQQTRCKSARAGFLIKKPLKYNNASLSGVV